MSNNALTVENLNKIYSNSKTKKENKALTDLNFEVQEGEDWTAWTKWSY